jgi:hypothetical protein
LLIFKIVVKRKQIKVKKIVIEIELVMFVIIVL